MAVFFSDEEILSGSNNSYAADFCLYGKDGVKISSDNYFGPGTVIGMNDTDDFQQGGNNEGAEEALQEMDKDLLLPGLAPEVIALMESGALSELPDFIVNGPVLLDEITDSTPLSPGTLYVVNEVADFGSDTTVANIAVVAGKEVKVGSNVTIENVVFASPDKILLGSNNDVGSQDYCGGGSYNVYLFSESNIEFGSNNDLRGVQMGAGEELKLGSNVAALMNVYGEANGKIDYGSAEDMGACADGLDSHFGSISLTESPAELALVR